MEKSYHGVRTGTSACEPGLLVIYDLRDSETRARAFRELQAWGRTCADVHRLDNDHILILFRPGRAWRLSA